MTAKNFIPLVDLSRTGTDWLFKPLGIVTMTCVFSAKSISVTKQT